MSSIDELFKRPNLPNSISKRKRDDPRNYNDIFKSQKTTVNGDVKGKRHATVEDEPVEENGYDEDAEAGPDLPLEDDDDDDVEAGPQLEDDGDDEEGGRFFGAGANNEILDYMDAQGEQDIAPEKIDNAWLRRTALGFEKKISKNRELRSKFEDDPLKFMESEGDLDAEIKGLSMLSEHTALYLEFVKLGSLNSLIQLLLHENTDIAINAISILAELTDEDANATQDQWNALVGAMLEADIIDLLLDVLKGLNDNDTSDREGIALGLSLLENLCNHANTLATILDSDQNMNLLNYILALTQKHATPLPQNTQSASELLSIVASAQPTNPDTPVHPARTHLIHLNTIDSALQLLARYRKLDPEKGSSEEEFAANLFDTLDCLVAPSEGKSAFQTAEGIDLMLIMLREAGKFAKARALRLLDHATAGSSDASTTLCTRLVAAAGLKPLFKTFMRVDPQRDREGTEHVLSILASLLRNLPGDSAERIRTLAKFVEKRYEKVARLVALRDGFRQRLRTVDDEIADERSAIFDDDDDDDDKDREAREEEWLARRLDAGLFRLQTADVILAWLVAEDDGAAARITALLGDGGLASVKTTLVELLAGLGGEVLSEEEGMLKEVLGTLVEFLE